MPKRCNREGSIRQRPDGRWEARFCVGSDPTTGKLIRRSVYAKSQSECRKRMTELIASIDEGSYSEPSKMTLREWLEEWQQNFLGNVKPATRVAYDATIRNQILPNLGRAKLSELTALQIQRAYNTMQKGETQLSDDCKAKLTEIMRCKEAPKGGLLNAVLSTARTEKQLTQAETKALREFLSDKKNPLSAKEVYRVIVILNGVKPLSAKSIKNCNGVLHSALEQAMKLGIIRTNPTNAVTLPRIEKPKIQVMDETQIPIFLAACTDDVYGTMFKFTLFSGLRQEEVLGLQWDRVDLKQGTIFVDRQLTHPRKTGDKYELAATKTDNARTVFIAPQIVELLRTWKRKQAEQRLFAGSLYNDCGFKNLVFTDETGKFVCYEAVRRKFLATLKRAGLPANHFHSLRHGFATAALAQGTDLKTVSELLGHSTPATTAQIYAHSTEQMKRASAVKMEQFIENLGNLNQG